MSLRYIRPETNYSREIPNRPFVESDAPVPAGDLSLQTNLGPVKLGDLTVVRGKLRVETRINDNENQDYGVF